MTALVWLLTAVVVVLAVLVVGLLRSHATILAALHDAGIDLDPDRDHDGPVSPTSPDRADDDPRTGAGVPGPAGAAGRRAAPLVGRTPEGGTKTVAVDNGTTTLLAFLTTGCRTCAGFWEALADQPDLPDDIRVVVVTKGPESESPAEVAALAPAGAVTIQSSQAWTDHRVPVAPYFVLIDGRRGVVVGEGAAATWDRVQDLLRRALADAGLGEGRIGRRELLGRHRPGTTGRGRVERDLSDAGLDPGDPRLFHDGGRP